MVFPWFDVIGILSGFAHYADVTDVIVACSCSGPVATLTVSPCFSVFVLSACSFHVLVLRTPAVPFLGQVWP